MKYKLKINKEDINAVDFNYGIMSYGVNVKQPAEFGYVFKIV